MNGHFSPFLKRIKKTKMTMTHARAIVLCFLRVTIWLPPILHIAIIRVVTKPRFTMQLFIGPRIAVVLNYFSALSVLSIGILFSSFGILFQFPSDRRNTFSAFLNRLTLNLSGESDIIIQLSEENSPIIDLLEVRWSGALNQVGLG